MRIMYFLYFNNYHPTEYKVGDRFIHNVELTISKTTVPITQISKWGRLIAGNKIYMYNINNISILGKYFEEYWYCEFNGLLEIYL